MPKVGPRVRIHFAPARSQQRTVFEKACYRNPCPGYAAALSDAPAISAAIKQITIFACVGRTHEIRMEPAQQAEITRVLSSVGEHSCALASRYRFFDAMLGMALAGCQKRHQVLSSKLDGLYLATRRDAKVDPQKSPVSKFREYIGMNSLLGQRAVVVGAGVGGLSMAGALANCFEQVEVLERDRLTASVGSRSGTPQDRHPHALLAGGLRALDEIFPGFADDLAGAGAVAVRVAQDIQFERPDVGLVPKRDFGISLLCASRPLIEFVLRRRAETIKNIALRPQCRVTEIVPAGTNDAVQGVRIDIGSGRSEMIAADLIVDASGRGALTLALLDAVAWQRPEVTEVGVDISYVSAVVEIPPDPPPEWKLAVTFPDPPHLALNAVLLPIEGGRWMVLVADRGATYAAEKLEELSRRMPLTRHADNIQRAPAG